MHHRDQEEEPGALGGGGEVSMSSLFLTPYLCPVDVESTHCIIIITCFFLSSLAFLSLTFLTYVCVRSYFIVEVFCSFFSFVYRSTPSYFFLPVYGHVDCRSWPESMHMAIKETCTITGGTFT